MTSFRKLIRLSALGLIAALLMAFTAIVWFGFKNVLGRYVDSRLQFVGGAWSAIIEHNAAMLPDFANRAGSEVAAAMSEAVTPLDLREAALSILVLDLEGRDVWKSTTVGTTPPLDRELWDQVIQGEVVYDTIVPVHGTVTRRVSVPIRQNGQVQYVLQAETPLTLADQALNSLLVLLGSASVLTLTLAWFGSRWLSRQVLRPIELLSKTAQAVSESSLEMHLNLDPHYEEFRRLGQALNTMMDRLKRVFESQRRFVADAAHEIQTPLTVLKGDLEVAFRKKRRAAEYREVLISNLRQVERLIHLSGSLITLAKCAGGEASSERQPLMIEPLVRDLVEELTTLAEDRRIGITLGTQAIPPVLGSEGQLKRVLINLIGNALRYTAPGGTITVELRPDGSDAIISVRDNGQGIASEHIPHIFERFYRVNNGHEEGEQGTGLGLAIVKELVEAHGGRVDVESQPGLGSCFTIRLPICTPFPERDREREDDGGQA